MKTIFTVTLSEDKKQPTNRIFKGEIERVVDEHSIADEKTLDIEVASIVTDVKFKLQLEVKDNVLKVVNAVDQGGINQKDMFADSIVEFKMDVNFKPVDIGPRTILTFLEEDLPESVTIVKSGYDFDIPEHQLFHVIRETPHDYGTSLMTRADIRTTFKIEV